jgi:hypothetical protein
MFCNQPELYIFLHLCFISSLNFIFSYTHVFATNLNFVSFYTCVLQPGQTLYFLTRLYSVWETTAHQLAKGEWKFRVASNIHFILACLASNSCKVSRNLKTFATISNQPELCFFLHMCFTTRPNFIFSYTCVL